jgi:hypothetical protein
MGKSGQLSIETMILYGLIALVALAAVAALIYFDVLNLGSYLPDKCDIGGSGDLNCEELKVTSQTNEGLIVSLGIRNVGQRTLTNVKVCIDGEVFMQEDLQASPIQEYCDTIASLSTGEIQAITVPHNVRTEDNLKGSFNARLKASYEYAGGVVPQAAVGSLRAKINNLN